jgi:hypothetical protein
MTLTGSGEHRGDLLGEGSVFGGYRDIHVEAYHVGTSQSALGRLPCVMKLAVPSGSSWAIADAALQRGCSPCPLACVTALVSPGT